MSKRYLQQTVLEAARERIAFTFDTFPRICVSFSGGKDSSVMTHLVMEEAIKRGRKVGLLFIDLEAQYKLTIDHVQEIFDLYADHIEPYWVCLPMSLRNAVSVFEPRWECWDPKQQDKWVRQPPKGAITDPDFFPFFWPGQEFEEFIDYFAKWFSQGKATASLVGIRTDESLNRWRTIAGNKARFEDKHWTTWKGDGVFSAYPIYDWKTEDIWRYCGRHGKPYNKLYDLMHKAGLTLHQQRICQPYGDDQRKGLWLYHLIEPETWGRVVARVAGANSGSLYAQESGNMLGRIKISKPEGHTWQSFAGLLLETMPPQTRDHFENKIAVFLKWWEDRGYPQGIPDEADAEEEANRKVPSWRRVCRTLLRNDYWCKGLSFTQTKSDAYERYKKVMENRRKKWGMSRLPI